jgi:diguanylate cyclase (GGDEF)-like protein
VFGWSASAYAANREVSQNARVLQRSFGASSAQIASTLKLAIQHEQDLVVNAAAFLAANPDARPAEFLSWTKSVRAFERYDELLSLGTMALVPASELPAYAARMSRPGQPFKVFPSGVRPFYCFVAASVSGPSHPGMASAPTPGPGLDLCAAQGATASLAIRDAGVGSYVPYGPMGLAIQTPYYRGGVVPKTTTERRQAFLGFFGTLINPQAVLESALKGHPGMGVTLHYQAAGSNVAFSMRVPHAAAPALVIDLGNSWTAETVGASAAAGIFGPGTARELLLGGSAVSLLLALLVFVLGTGRARARRMLHLKTAEIRYQALHDGLTGLPNRALILDRVQQALARARRNDTSVAVMFLDLDGFKGVNDTFGHAVGDQLLRAVGTRLAGVLRGADTVGRLGGDEFVVLLEHASLAAGADEVAERIQAVLTEPFNLETPELLTLHTHASIGIATGLRDSADEFLRDADVAMYEAKATGKNCYVRFAAEMHVAIQDRLELELDLFAAIDTDQFFLVYQPTYDLREVTMTGVEALLRWQHPTRGLVMPDTFIPMLEETGLIIAVGRRVLAEACRDAAAWTRRGTPLTVSVNVSGRQLDNDVDLRHDVEAALGGSGLDPAQLMLEITETMLMRDAVVSAEKLRALKELGVRIAIDDFGTGYSSLAYLQQFPVDALKIDRTFINEMVTSPEGGALIHTFVQLGRTLGIQTYAEGIEERDQLERLRQEECDHGQGYLFARPLMPEAISTLLGNSADVDNERGKAAVPRQGNRGLDAPRPQPT